jgi:hypothetical protein
VVFDRLSGSSPETVFQSSSVVEDADKGRQTVGGRDKPGKETSKTLMMGAILRALSLFLASLCDSKGEVVAEKRTEAQRCSCAVQLLIGCTETKNVEP